MALKGNLKDFSLTQLLNLIRLARKTGDLTIEESGGPLHVFCQDGRLTGLMRDGRKTPLVDVMVKGGRVTEDELKLVRPHLALNSDKELALRLMDLGVVSRDDVMQVVSQQMLETLYPFFSASKGSFNFDPDALPAEDDITVAMELEAVILEGGRRIREAGRLQEVIPSLDIVPRLSPQQRCQDAQHQPVRGPMEGDLLHQWAQHDEADRRLRRAQRVPVAAGLPGTGDGRTGGTGRAGQAASGGAKQRSRCARPPSRRRRRRRRRRLSKNILMRLIDRVRRL